MLSIKDKGAVLTLGEILLRITPDANGHWIENNQVPFFIGGAELNVATATALWGLQTKYFTAMPDNGITEQLLKHLEQKKIDVSAVYKGGDRLGLFYLTKGSDMKDNALIYDRAGSSFSNLSPENINWDDVFNDVRWFHFSAICPALTQQTANVCEQALQEASARRIIISVDLNHRTKLWQYGKSPLQIMPQLVKHCDLVMGNIWSIEAMLNIPVIAGINENGLKSAYLKQAQGSSQILMQQFPKCKAVANTFRFGEDNNITYYSALYIDGRLHQSAEYQSDAIVDKVGSGDCFMAGLIYGFCSKWNAEDTVAYATAAAFTKLFIPSDATTYSVKQIKKAIRK